MVNNISVLYLYLTYAVDHLKIYLHNTKAVTTLMRMLSGDGTKRSLRNRRQGRNVSGWKMQNLNWNRGQRRNVSSCKMMNLNWNLRKENWKLRGESWTWKRKDGHLGYKNKN